MAWQDVIWTSGIPGNGCRKIVAALVTDVVATDCQLGDELLETTSGLKYDLVSTAGTLSWKRGTVGAAGTPTAMGTGTIGGSGFVNIVPGPAMSASARIEITRTVAAGGAHAYGLLTVSSKVPGIAGVANFTVSAISEAAGALVAADASTFDYIVFEP